MQTLTAVAAAWLLCFAAVGIVSASGIGRWRLRRLARQRRGEGYRTFAASLARTGVSDELAGTLYWYVQTWTTVSGFPVRPGDLLRDTLGMGPEHVEDALVTVAALTGCGEITRRYGMEFGPVLTVGDLARFLAPLAPAAVVAAPAARARMSSATLRRIA